MAFTHDYTCQTSDQSETGLVLECYQKVDQAESKACKVYVVVHFYPWFNFFFCFKLIIIHYQTKKQKKL